MKSITIGNIHIYTEDGEAMDELVKIVKKIMIIYIVRKRVTLKI